MKEIANQYLLSKLTMTPPVSVDNNLDNRMVKPSEKNLPYLNGEKKKMKAGEKEG